MKIFYTVLLIAISLISFSQEVKWTPCKCSENMKAKSAIVDPLNSKVSLTIEINANVDVVLAAVKDIPAYNDWLYNLEEIEEIDYKGDGDGLYRAIVKAPFPLLDIESFIKWKVVKKDDEILVVQSCIPYYKPYDERYQRVTRYDAVWHIKPLSDSKVQVSYLLKMGSPKNLPKVLLKLYLCDAPTKSFKEFKKICENK